LNKYHGSFLSCRHIFMERISGIVLMEGVTKVALRGF